jgi:hypothetical protein
MATRSDDEHGHARRVILHSRDDISAALMAALDGGGLVLLEEDLGPDFFNLRTGLAGELFQKFATYRARLAIVLTGPAAHGERFAELVHEHRRHPTVRFFNSLSDAQQWLTTPDAIR